MFVSAGELRVLYSHQMVDQSERATGDSPLTLWQVREVIHHHVGAQQCAAFTYLSIEGDLVVLIMPVTMYPTPLQVCTLHPYMYVPTYLHMRL